MSSSLPASQHSQHPFGSFAEIAPYATPPLAAALAILPAFPDMVAKSAQQQGNPPPVMSCWKLLKGGLRAAPTGGLNVGMQCTLQGLAEKAFAGESNKPSFPALMASSALIGAATSPIVAVLNGQSMGWSVKKTLLRFTPRQALAIAFGETVFVCGLGAGRQLEIPMKEHFGDNKIVECAAAAIAGATGSVIGHPANTVVTLLQNDLPVKNFRQLWWGVLRRTRCVATFAIFFKLGKDTLNPPS